MCERPRFDSPNCQPDHLSLPLFQPLCVTIQFVSQDSDDWEQIIGPVHQRSAERVLHGALKNGGLYIKLGQGLVSMNHILPKPYLDTLVVLQDKALHSKAQQVSVWTATLNYAQHVRTVQ